MYSAKTYIDINKLYANLLINKPKTLEKNLEKVIKSIQSKEIEGLTIINTGLAFRYSESKYTEVCSKFLKSYFADFKNVALQEINTVANPVNYPFSGHGKIYTLLFINFDNDIFKGICNKIVEECYEEKVRTVIKEVFDQHIYSDPHFAEVEAIEPRDFDYIENYSNLLNDEDFEIEDYELTSSLRELFVNSLIDEHTVIHSTIMKLANQLKSELGDTIGEMRAGPIKQHARANDKMLTYAKQLKKPCPWYMMRDITRYSIMVNDMKKYAECFHRVIKWAGSNGVQVLEVKNSFKNPSKYMYKHVMVILEVKAYGFVCFVELQIIHKHILELKKVNHKFYDISRASFDSLRFDYYSNWMDMVLYSLKVDQEYVYVKNQNLLDKMVHQGQSLEEKCQQLSKSYKADHEIKDGLYEGTKLYTKEGMTYFCNSAMNISGLWNSQHNCPFMNTSIKGKTLKFQIDSRLDNLENINFGKDTMIIKGISLVLTAEPSSIKLESRMSHMDENVTYQQLNVDVKEGKVKLDQYYHYLEDGEITRSEVKDDHCEKMFVKNINYTVFKKLKKTKNNYSYEEFFTDKSVNYDKEEFRFRFRVKATNDAHIALTKDGDENGDMFEIVLGGWGNSSSVIRTKKQGEAHVTLPCAILNNGKSMKDKDKDIFEEEFWIAYGKEKGLRVGKGNLYYKDTVMEYNKAKFVPLNIAKVCTGWGSSGEWSLQKDFKTIHTLDSYNYTKAYKYEPDYKKSQFQVKFQLKASNDAHIALTKDGDENVDMFEIVLGGWGNSNSGIRTKKQGALLAEFKGKVLDKANYLNYWMTYSHNGIQIGQGLEINKNVILNYKSDTFVPLNEMKVCTAWGSTGDWKILYETEEIESTKINQKSGSITVKTLDKYQYTDAINTKIDYNCTSFLILVQVKASNDAHIALTKDGNENGDMFEIVLGGWGNSNSGIRTKKQGPLVAEYQDKILDKNTFKNFWIKYDKNGLKMGKGHDVNENTILQFLSPKLVEINNLKVCTAWGSTGIWMISTPFEAADDNSKRTTIVSLKTLDKYYYTKAFDKNVDYSKDALICTFKVKASNDAHIALTKDGDENGDMFEIVLGGWGNSNSGIRTKKQGPLVTEYHGSVLNPRNCVEFWLKYDKSGLYLSKSSLFSNPILHYSGKFTELNNIKVCTGWGSNGEWIFEY